MAYSVVLDVRKALTAGASADDSTTASELMDFQMADAIVEADAQIDGKLANRYAVPVASPIPDLLRAISRDIAAYLCTLTWLGGEPLDPAHPVNLRFIRATQLLDQLQNGQMIIPAIPAPSDDQSRYDPVVFNNYDGQLFTNLDFDLLKSPWNGFF